MAHENKIRQTLNRLTVVMGIAVAVLCLFLGRATLQQINLLRFEDTSIQASGEIRNMITHLIEQSDAEARLAGGDSSARGQLTDAAALIDSDLKSIESRAKEFQQTSASSEKLAAMESEWQRLKEKDGSAAAGEGEEIRSNLYVLAAEQMTFVERQVHAQNFSLGGSFCGKPLRDLAGTYAALAKLRDSGRFALSRKKLSDEERKQLGTNLAAVQGGLEEVKSQLEGNFDRDPQLAENASATYASAIQSTNGFLQTVNDQVLRPPALSMDPGAYSLQGSAALTSMSGLYDAVRTVREKSLISGIVSLEWRLAGYIGFAVLSFFFFWAVGSRFGQSCAEEIRTITMAMDRIIRGDYSARVRNAEESEFRAIAEGLNKMLEETTSELIQLQEERDRIQRSIERLVDEMSSVASGDLTKEADVTAEITGAIADSFNYMTSELRQIVSRVQETTMAVSFSGTEVLATADHLAQGSAAQAEQIGKASAAIGDMAISIQKVSDNAKSAAEIADRANRNSRDGAEAVRKTLKGMNAIRERVQQTSSRMKDLTAQSDEIEEIVQLIGDLSDRTSMISLNASIQARVAGEAGKSFAVVVEEIERLADQSNEASKRIGTLMKAIQTDTKVTTTAMEETRKEVMGGSALAKEASQKLAEIETVSNELSRIIQSISQATTQQAQGSESVTRLMSDISGVTQQSAEGARIAAVSIRQLAELTDDLRMAVDRFKLPGVVQ